MKRVFRCRKCKYEFIVRARDPRVEVSLQTGQAGAPPAFKIRCPKCKAELSF